jgi:hypothetical protein
MGFPVTFPYMFILCIGHVYISTLSPSFALLPLLPPSFLCNTWGWAQGLSFAHFKNWIFLRGCLLLVFCYCLLLYMLFICLHILSFLYILDINALSDACYKYFLPFCRLSLCACVSSLISFTKVSQFTL